MEEESEDEEDVEEFGGEKEEVKASAKNSGVSFWRRGQGNRRQAHEGVQRQSKEARKRRGQEVGCEVGELEFPFNHTPATASMRTE